MAVRGRSYPNPPIVSRGSLEDAVAEAATTPSPVVVAAHRPPRPQPPVVLARAHLEDLATPAPLVVALSPVRRPAAQALVLRAHFVDDPVLTTPPPVVVAAPAWRRPTCPVVSRTPLHYVVAPLRLGTATVAARSGSSTASGAGASATTAARSTTTTGG